MACTSCNKDLNAQLSGQDPGGSWYYRGVAATSGGALNPPSNFPTCDGGTALLIGNPTGNVNAVSCPSTVCFDGADTGFHKFTYEVETGSCSATADIEIQVLDTPDPGTPPGTQTYCTADDAFTIWDLWSSAPAVAGTWKVSSTGLASPGYNDEGSASDITDDTFDPGAATPGTYTFIHTITVTNPSSGTHPTNCAGCTQEATITISIVETPNAGTPSNITVCNG